MIVFRSFDVFAKLSKEQIFMVDALRWTPVRFATWIFETNQRPGLVRLRENRAYGHEVAARLIEEKKQGLKDGASRKDILTLLGSSRVAFMKIDSRYNFQSFSQSEFLPEARFAA